MTIYKIKNKMFVWRHYGMNEEGRLALEARIAAENSIT